MAKIFLIDALFLVRRARSPKPVAALVAGLAQLWKSERVRHLACVFAPDSDPVPLLEQACRALGVPSYRLEPYSVGDILATLAVKASQAGHEPVIVANNPALSQLCVHPRVSLLRITGPGKNPSMETFDSTRFDLASASGHPLRTDLPLDFSLEAVTPGGFEGLADFYRQQDMKRHLEPFEDKLFQPGSVMELWS